MQEEERIPHKFDEPLELSGVDINSLFQESNMLPLSAHQKYKYTKDVLSQKKKKKNTTASSGKEPRNLFLMGERNNKIYSSQKLSPILNN